MPQAQPDVVPNDGLTTRQRRNRPLLMVHTGDGKGKSTAAFGLALRGWNQGWSVGVFQFVKSAKWRIGEQTALETLATVHDERGTGGPIEWHKMGSGWSWSRREGTNADHAAEAAEGWAEIKRRLAAETHGLYVLDEFTYPINWGWVDIDDVVTTLTSRTGHQHVVITGRRADPKLLDAADLVTEMTNVKHPFGAGQKGPTGDRMVSPGPSTALPRVVIAAPASGHGKTTVAIGLMAALRNAGHVVSGHKVGPDYIDPGYHALATGRPARNLDPHLVGVERLVPLLLHGAATPVPADIAVIEGVMGLYDGAIGREGFASTAHVAGIISAPVILVIDISSASRTIAAVVHGLASFDNTVRIAGVILNKAGSVRHSTEVTDALEATGIPVLGVLNRDDGIAAPARHLGLIPAAERDDARAALDRLAGQIAAGVDLDEVLRIARGAGELAGNPWDPTAEMLGVGPAPDRSRPVVAVAGGRAFTFRYTETDELMRAAGLRTGGLRPDLGHRSASRDGWDLSRRRLPGGTRGGTICQSGDARSVAGGGQCRCADGGRMCRPAVPGCRRRRSTDGRSPGRECPDDAQTDVVVPYGHQPDRLVAGTGRISGHRARVPPHHGGSESGGIAGLVARRGPGRLQQRSGRYWVADRARVLPAHPLGRSSGAGGEVRPIGTRLERRCPHGECRCPAAASPDGIGVGHRPAPSRRCGGR